MKKEAINAAVLATAAVSLALAGAVPTAKAETGRVHCLGANGCQGKSDCHTPNNARKGKNACKGQGWLDKDSAQACADAGGKVLD